MTKAEQFAQQAEGWSESAYADPRAYLEHRAELIVRLGAPLAPGDTVLDLACGDGGLGLHLLTRGIRYRGADAEQAMVDAAGRRLGDAAVVELGDLDGYAPPGPVDCTTVFRALYYARDRAAFFRRVRSFTTTKLVFDLDPRRFSLPEVLDELARAGFARTATHPFLIPQSRSLPGPALAALVAAERSSWLSRALLRTRFTYLVAGVVDDRGVSER